MGNYATHFILEQFGLPNSRLGISQLRGQKFAARDSLTQKPYVIIPLYHPAVAVYDSRKLDDLKNDFKIIEEQLKEV